ncbi:hypothetical protein [Streptomyces sp. NBC_00582]|uniref:hypothetical protein n=1 Tax=Streptomyces sp. NBC_00582 TaxID=2975783 RepID=UPI002E823F88|nr:hypothetical protein [Streptomyces sp. NBC_00582]WUB64469.1 hypothetical protein OG852_30775 [Streptomyces sp. NBC_00582]
MTTRTQSWTVSLQDSVYALGAAARECQAAHRAAAIAHRHVDLDRIRLLDGKVLCRHVSYTGEQEPHLTSLSRIGDVQMKAEQRLNRLYEEAARAYAHGANWAVRQVLSGQQPAHVELKVDADGLFVLGETMPVLQLDRCASASALEAARRTYERCIVAGFEAEGIASQDEIADYEAGEMHAALDVAAGLPDAAYAYGELAEGAVHWAISNRARASRE